MSPVTSAPVVSVQADFSQVRYAQCWEDADVLLEALAIRPHHVCLSIASGGDNTLAMLACNPRRVIALDLSQAQLACLELRVAAYRELEYGELLELYGSVPSRRRDLLYRRCRPLLAPAVRGFWDARPGDILQGIGACGKFERYLAHFREHFLPLIHSQNAVNGLFLGRTIEEREVYYERVWNTWAWRAVFRAFFSRPVMGRMGRDPSFFRYVEGDVAGRILERARHALTTLDPAANPYAQWILTGSHRTALPFALRRENFDAIRDNLDRLEYRRDSLENFLASSDAGVIHCFNLSDVFEYMPLESYHRILETIAAGQPHGSRLAYWNLLAPRHRPEEMAPLWQPLTEFAARLHAEDKTFFYQDFVLEERR